ncbi:hypothetical protein CDAR_599491 [Caerostris darwini]|uniref:Uncharacterized protein n=1 Tax=Caerostris darwini TaxID=1538125 RepID=A0AAV4NWI7_9ARAC|nr:hypothetical protein CDAR_599491 [Caerostris darwini]
MVEKKKREGLYNVSMSSSRSCPIMSMDEEWIDHSCPTFVNLSTTMTPKEISPLHKGPRAIPRISTPIDFYEYGRPVNIFVTSSALVPYRFRVSPFPLYSL